MNEFTSEKRRILYDLLDEIYRNACAKIEEADKKVEYYLAKQDFNTAAYWTKKYGDAWDESEELRMAIDKIRERA